jgi:hypothetical protein
MVFDREFEDASDALHSKTRVVRDDANNNMIITLLRSLQDGMKDRLALCESAGYLGSPVLIALLMVVAVLMHEMPG